MTTNILTYQYKMGTCSLNDLIRLVKEKELTEEDFFEITRLNYQGLIKSREGKQKE